MIKIYITEYQLQKMWPRLFKEEQEHFTKELESAKKKIEKFQRKKENNQAYQNTNSLDILHTANLRRIKLKDNPTKSENIFRTKLTSLKEGYIFQKIIYKDSFYSIVDFYIPKRNLIIEIDGGYHEEEEQIAKDKWRENNLKSLGFKNILRFTNEQVYDLDTETLDKAIKAYKIVDEDKLPPQIISEKANEKILKKLPVPKATIKKPKALKKKRERIKAPKGKSRKRKSSNFKFLSSANQ